MLPLPDFNPPPELASRILDSVTDPTITLRDVAELHDTTVEALVVWFARPEIAERLDQIESAIARRTRIVASNFLPSVTTTLGRSIDEHNSDEAHFPVRPTDQRGMELRRRSRETARRAAGLLVRLANFTPGPRPRTHAGDPSASLHTDPRAAVDGAATPRALPAQHSADSSAHSSGAEPAQAHGPSPDIRLPQLPIPLHAAFDSPLHNNGHHHPQSSHRNSG
ncbi:MAG: hypothetical protein KF745_10255 [Phycisphaeraceae bacterium]|nr:hypothetical protein [Phycisphaeraceae bacterium]